MTNSIPTLKTDSKGTKEWHLNGKRHRTDGPAVEGADGCQEWWVKGKRHRIDGPALEYANGTKEWWANGVLHRAIGPAIETVDGTRAWYVNGKQHRTDGPAIERADGTRAWWTNGELHRTNGPAIERPDGYKAWYLNDKLDRADGPAVEWADGAKTWYVNGSQISAPYSHVLTAAFDRGLPIPPEVLVDMPKVTLEIPECGEENAQVKQLNVTLHQYWPMHVKKILTTLFMDTEPNIKHLALWLLGSEALPESPRQCTPLAQTAECREKCFS